MARFKEREMAVKARAKRLELATLCAAFIAFAVGGCFAHALWLLDALVFVVAAWNDGTNLFTWHRRLAWLRTAAESNILFFAFLAAQVALFPVTFLGYIVTGFQRLHRDALLEREKQTAILEAQAGIVPAFEEKRCVHCDCVAKFTGQYCPSCGRPQNQEMARPALKICNACSAASYATAAYCSRCGTSLADERSYQLIDPNLAL